MSGSIIAGGPRVPAELVTDAGLNVESDGDLVLAGARTVDFEGAGVSVTTVSGVAVVTITGGAGGTVETDATLKGTGTSGDLLGINPGHVAVVPDGTTIGGNGTTGSPLHTIDGATGVAVDGTSIAGTGKTGAPLHTIAGGTAVAVDGTSVTGSGLTGSPLHAHVIVEKNETVIVAAATTFNFTGAGVTVSNSGGGVAAIAIDGGGGGSLTVTDGDAVSIDDVTTLTLIGGVVTTDGVNEATFTVSNPADVTVTFEEDVNPGTAVYILTSDGNADLASAGATELQTQVLGLSIAAHGGSATGLIRTSGPLTLTTGQWDARTGDGPGGLAPGQIYYLSDGDELGDITSTKPSASGSWVAPVGYGLTPTTLVIRVQLPVQNP